jgi:hypothetical protein
VARAGLRQGGADLRQRSGREGLTSKEALENADSKACAHMPDLDLDMAVEASPPL